jgi:hypothetical protein
MTNTPKTEDEKRADEVLRRMLNTPPKPRKGKQPGASYLVIDGKFRVAGGVKENRDGSITSDVYRNLDDFRNDRAMERAARFAAG